ncbi:MAG: phosphate ABC transporter permease PstA [Actinomycetota bacterium]|nr:phosphate ABC transporter permease PstA [Actinomycetota bacterium]
MTVTCSEHPASLQGRPAMRRKVADAAALAAGYVALAMIAVPTIWVVAGVLQRAVPGWSWGVLTHTGAAGAGGLENEILGSLVLTAGTLVLAGGVGVLAGIYLAEYATGPAGAVLRGASEVLAGIPSIVLGYVGYLALVVALHWSFSLAAGLVTLAVMTVPYVMKSTEVALRQVPSAYREGAEALGFSPLQALRRISLRTALPGIVTGILVALAISVGETAPLLYTAGFTSANPSAALVHRPIAFLTYAIWTFYNQPSKSAVQLSFDAALILLVIVLLLIVVGRVIVSLSERHAETR